MSNGFRLAVCRKKRSTIFLLLSVFVLQLAIFYYSCSLQSFIAALKALNLLLLLLKLSIFFYS